MASVRLRRSPARHSSSPFYLVGFVGYRSDNGQRVRLEGEVELTRDQPIMAVEFQATFDTLQSSDLLGMLSMRAEDLNDATAVRRELWDGEGWVSYWSSPGRRRQPLRRRGRRVRREKGVRLAGRRRR